MRSRPLATETDVSSAVETDDVPDVVRYRTSVIVPARNAQQTIVQTLESLRAQSDGNWEAIVVDDGSTDDTAALVTALATGDQRIRLLNGAAVGVSAARNLGIAKAKSDRILFLDADDWIDSRFLALMNAALDEHPDADAAYCNYCRVTPDGIRSEEYRDSTVAVAPFDRFSTSCAVAIHAVIIRRDLLLDINGFDTTLRTCEDWDLWQRAARDGRAWVHVDQMLSFYRSRSGSLSRNSDQLLFDGLEVYRRSLLQGTNRMSLADVTSLALSDKDRATFEQCTYFTLWCGAQDCVAGGTGDTAIQMLSRLPVLPYAIDIIADSVLEAASVGLTIEPMHLAARWADFGPKLSAYFARIERAWNHPDFARQLQYRFEERVLDYDDLADQRILTRTVGLRVDLKAPRATVIPPGVDRVYAYLCFGSKIRSLICFGALGTISQRDWLSLAIARIGAKPVVFRSPLSLVRGMTLAGVRRSVRLLARIASRVFQKNERQENLGPLLTEALQASLLAPSAPSSHRQLLELISSSERAVSSVRYPDCEILPRESRTSEEEIGIDSRSAYWEEVFRREDPWNYTSQYEQEKYEHQLALLPNVQPRRALELACAEGHFTRQLAPRVASLIATDISPTAVARARERCVTLPNVEFGTLDFVSQDLPSALDLIVCSEVLYYQDSIDALRMVVDRMATALEPGGAIVTAHARVLTDDPARTGFDWGVQFGGETIARVFGEHPNLVAERTIATDLYRVDRFVRTSASETGRQADIQNVDRLAPVEPSVARDIVWNGAIVTRAQVAVTERSDRMPVLMYHDIADDGPQTLQRFRLSKQAFRDQMLWLRRNGFHSIRSDELVWFLEHQHPFVGRPVLITFDDAYKNFADNAWPVLYEHNLSAEVFVVTDLIGKTSEWDARFGSNSPLMDVTDLQLLARQGVSFGSHLASHRPATGLGTRDLASEMLRSRMALERLLNKPVASLAVPFGLGDERVRILAS